MCSQRLVSSMCCQMPQQRAWDCQTGRERLCCGRLSHIYPSSRTTSPGRCLTDGALTSCALTSCAARTPSRAVCCRMCQCLGPLSSRYYVF
ncbi:hypothetical protein DPMN_059111 [Dreissena polymorpha]|uniref:Uncharacterized protein n=1 Tax=Dreissena polymorpha TaxID=45954 RepID=A0A9D4HG92_DREPO|nr:hypothetical protein DPMN_059111 [Dreissena polymorpha]